MKTGLRIFGWFTLLQILVGVWLLIAQPKAVIQAYMGGDLWLTFSLGLGIVCGVVASVYALRDRFTPTLIFLLITMVLMVLNRALLRSFNLAEHFSPTELIVKPQYDLLILFLVVFLVGIYAVYYMLRKAAKADGGEVIS